MIQGLRSHRKGVLISMTASESASPLRTTGGHEFNVEREFAIDGHSTSSVRPAAQNSGHFEPTPEDHHGKNIEQGSTGVAQPITDPHPGRGTNCHAPRILSHGLMRRPAVSEVLRCLFPVVGYLDWQRPTPTDTGFFMSPPAVSTMQSAIASRPSCDPPRGALHD
jgi:hypothetical protein